ncbi:MAG: hypothetical protein AUK24_09155 [Syntrophaceae bacterium CG2_30_49_12]|nr:MAG: hypothetical protein AUK24_09155 [Syntrophaceae bacterium CG2_30_49_12]PIP05817.1 MAG: disulfide bond formation regulator [Syntrophobacterales bacterium CG23_combo_of_CG06-09_8_20_14_all_48_27]PJA49507.1 MAG: disulfide bond formation regulator [Syntrophobacterales bacterium CG_4_9_14_3_um_filter_49_8]PJC72866.1 MAG: disulfide bond formation regulator [Syntrophobacterales bacterium CG_4_8_14_3_um_filter_49_14]
MGLNNINTDAAEKFMEEAKNDPQIAKKSKRVEGEWVFEEGEPQFKATLTFKEGEQVVKSDFAPFMGGRGLAPDPIQYCLYGLAACYAGTIASLATMEGIPLRGLKIAVENKVDLTRTLGLSSNPIVEGVEVTITLASDAPRERLEEIEALARDRCPGVYCLTNPIQLTTRLVTGDV